MLPLDIAVPTQRQFQITSLSANRNVATEKHISAGESITHNAQRRWTEQSESPQNIQFPAWPLEGEPPSPTKLFKCADFATKINTLTVWNHSNSFENTHHRDLFTANVTQPLSRLHSCLSGEICGSADLCHTPSCA